MRRFSIIYILGIMACCLVSCMGQIQIDEPQTGDSDVPIEFRFANTKVAIRGVADLVDNKAIFGMYAIDEDYARTNGLSADDGLNMRNQLCRYVAATADEMAGLRFGYSTEDKTIYFPMGVNHEYTFYTYHRWASKLVDFGEGPVSVPEPDYMQTVSNVSTTETSVYAPIPLANSYDVLWAKTHRSYNAATIKSDGEVPTFYFKHPAAGISFHVVLDEESQKTISKNDHLRLMHLAYTGAESGQIATGGALCLVDLNNPVNEGKFMGALEHKTKVMWTNPATSSGNLNFDLLADADANTIIERCLDEPELLFSENFILPMNEPLKVELSFRKQRISGGSITGNKDLHTHTFELDPADFGADHSGYKAGMMYNYKIVVKFMNNNPSVFDSGEIKVSIVRLDSPNKVVED